MARLDDRGRVISSGKGMKGLTVSWSWFQHWLEYQLPAQAAQARAAKPKKK